MRCRVRTAKGGVVVRVKPFLASASPDEGWAPMPPVMRRRREETGVLDMVAAGFERATTLYLCHSMPAWDFLQFVAILITLAVCGAGDSFVLARHHAQFT